MSDQTTESTMRYADTVVTMDQMPKASANIVGHTPLHHVGLGDIAKQQKAKNGAVKLTELGLRGHIVLRGKLTNADFTQAVEQVLGVSLPGILSFTTNGNISIRWISPDEWLVVVPGETTFEVEQALINAVNGNCAIVNVSGGQTVLVLEGENARKVLQKTVPYDVHDRNFPIGKVVTSAFSKTQAIISRTGESQWELVIRRSFSDYAWLWLQDSCAEFGLLIGQE